MRTASKNGEREFEFRKDEHAALDKAALILDDMKRYPERFPTAENALNHLRAAIGHIAVAPPEPPKQPAPDAKGK